MNIPKVPAQFPGDFWPAKSAIDKAVRGVKNSDSRGAERMERDRTPHDPTTPKTLRMTRVARYQIGNAAGPTAGFRELFHAKKP